MKNSSGILFPLFLLILIIVAFLTYYRTMVLRDYPVVESEVESETTEISG